MLRRLEGLVTDLSRGCVDPSWGERVSGAVILLADGDLRRLSEALRLARTDWRDLLMAAELAEWTLPARLDVQFGPA